MIPKIIHTIWLQGYEFLPEKQKVLHNNLKKLHSDFEFIVWDNKMIYSLLKKYPNMSFLYRDVDKLTGFIHSEIIQKNIASFVILKEFGGIYYNLHFNCLSLINNIPVPDWKEKGKKENCIYITNINSGKGLNKFTLDYWTTFLIPNNYYSSDYICIQKSHPIWDKVFEYIEKKNSKKEIHFALNKILKESYYPIILVECDNNFSKYTYLNINNNIKKNFYWEKIGLFLFVFLIIFLVDKINQYNIIKFNISSYIPGITHPPTSNLEIKDKKKKK
jgi:mannosyltransferase OCH1-like enzyme